MELLYNRPLYQGRIPAEKVPDEPNARRLKQSLALIPPGVRTVLDIGCGSGHVAEEVGRGLDVVGFDIDLDLLRVSTGKRIQGSSHRIPFADRSFDLVVALELLEHLPDRELKATCREMERVSRAYLLISVPYREQIENLFWRCGSCREVFHIYGHLRSFDEMSIRDCLPDATPLGFWKVKKKLRRFHPALLRLRQDYFHTYTYDRSAVCPRCGKREEKRTGRQFLLQAMFGVVNRLVSRVTPEGGWMVALLRKGSEEKI